MPRGPDRPSACTRLHGLVGWPVRRSLSPRMHNAAFRRRGIDAVYLGFEVPPERALEVPAAIRTLGLAGVNLTVPFKERLLPLLDGLDESARLAGSANTVLNQDGVLIGYNTDGEGLCQGLGDFDIEGRALVLGVGGTGRAVAAALAGRGMAEVVLLNRSLERARAAADALSAAFPGTLFPVEPLTSAAFARQAPGARLVVHCTAGSALIEDLDPAYLPTSSTWVDVNYWMEDPPLRQACLAHGLRFQTGHRMLAFQAALAFALFTGERIGGEEMLGYLEGPG